jgi:predicted ATPase
MNVYNKPNFYLFTGGSGAGKTTVIEELARLGYMVMPEVARNIIKEQNAIGGNATHLGDRNAYFEFMLKNSIRDFEMALPLEEPVFFDRGIPDLISYTHRFLNGIHPKVKQANTHYRYNQKAFLFPAWPEIFCQDSERKQTLEEAIDTYYAVKKGYTTAGYEIIEVPKTTPSMRADFILKTILSK